MSASLAGDVREEVAPGVAENTHVFGPGLVGTLAVPTEARYRNVALILFNAGLIQRGGPFRVYTKLARSLARQGFVVLRFDQAGLGDSAESVATDHAVQRLEATEAAMNLIKDQTGVDRFVLGGICSGADDALNVGPDNPRVDGLLLLDGAAYRTTGYKVRHYLPRLFRPMSVIRALMRLFQRARSGEPSLDSVDLFRDFPDRTEMILRLKRMIDRDASVLLLYTGGYDQLYNHPRQAGEFLGELAKVPNVSSLYLADCDHTFYLGEHRERLVREVGAWMQARYSR